MSCAPAADMRIHAACREAGPVDSLGLTAEQADGPLSDHEVDAAQPFS